MDQKAFLISDAPRAGLVLPRITALESSVIIAIGIKSHISCLTLFRVADPLESALS